MQHLPTDVRFVTSTEEAITVARQAGRFVAHVDRPVARRGEWFAWAAEHFQLPPYFGENWDALEECWRDLGWLPPEQPVSLVFDELPLTREKAERRALFSLLHDRLAEAARPGCRRWELIVAETLRGPFQREWRRAKSDD